MASHASSALLALMVMTICCIEHTGALTLEELVESAQQDADQDLMYGKSSYGSTVDEARQMMQQDEEKLSNLDEEDEESHHAPDLDLSKLDFSEHEDYAAETSQSSAKERMHKSLKHADQAMKREQVQAKKTRKPSAPHPPTTEVVLARAAIAAKAASTLQTKPVKKPVKKTAVKMTAVKKTAVKKTAVKKTAVKKVKTHAKTVKKVNIVVKPLKKARVSQEQLAEQALAAEVIRETAPDMPAKTVAKLAGKTVSEQPVKKASTKVVAPKAAVLMGKDNANTLQALEQASTDQAKPAEAQDAFVADLFKEMDSFVAKSKQQVEEEAHDAEQPHEAPKPHPAAHKDNRHEWVKANPTGVHPRAPSPKVGTEDTQDAKHQALYQQQVKSALGEAKEAKHKYQMAMIAETQRSKKAAAERLKAQQQQVKKKAAQAMTHRVTAMLSSPLHFDFRHERSIKAKKTAQRLSKQRLEAEAAKVKAAKLAVEKAKRAARAKEEKLAAKASEMKAKKRLQESSHRAFQVATGRAKIESISYMQAPSELMLQVGNDDGDEAPDSLASYKTNLQKEFLRQKTKMAAKVRAEAKHDEQKTEHDAVNAQVEALEHGDGVQTVLQAATKARQVTKIEQQSAKMEAESARMVATMKKKLHKTQEAKKAPVAAATPVQSVPEAFDEMQVGDLNEELRQAKQQLEDAKKTWDDAQADSDEPVKSEPKSLLTAILDKDTVVSAIPTTGTTSTTASAAVAKASAKAGKAASSAKKKAADYILSSETAALKQAVMAVQQTTQEAAAKPKVKKAAAKKVAVKKAAVKTVAVKTAAVKKVVKTTAVEKPVATKAVVKKVAVKKAAATKAKKAYRSMEGDLEDAVGAVKHMAKHVKKEKKKQELPSAQVDEATRLMLKAADAVKNLLPGAPSKASKPNKVKAMVKPAVVKPQKQELPAVSTAPNAPKEQSLPEVSSAPKTVSSTKKAKVKETAAFSVASGEQGKAVDYAAAINTVKAKAAKAIAIISQQAADAISDLHAKALRAAKAAAFRKQLRKQKKLTWEEEAASVNGPSKAVSKAKPVALPKANKQVEEAVQVKLQRLRAQLRKERQEHRKDLASAHKSLARLKQQQQKALQRKTTVDDDSAGVPKIGKASAEWSRTKSALDNLMKIADTSVGK